MPPQEPYVRAPGGRNVDEAGVRRGALGRAILQPMPWLPYWRFVIETPLPPKEVLRRLSAQVQPECLLRWAEAWGDQRPYEGQIPGPWFKIQRIPSGRNSFPVIQGTVTERDGGSLVQISMRMHVLVCIIMAVWIGLASTAALSMMFESGDGPGLFALALPLFGYLFWTIQFSLEASSARAWLYQLWGE